jgi:hypothetical protein
VKPSINAYDATINRRTKINKVGTKIALIPQKE